MSIAPDFEYDFDRSRAAWWVVIAALGALVLYVVYSFIGTFVLGLFVYYATRPLYQRLQPRVSSPTLAVIGTLLAFALPLLVLISYTLAVGLQELSSLTGGGLGQVTALISPYIDTSAALSNPQQLLGTLSAQSGIDTGSLVGILRSVGAYLGLVTTGLVQIFVVLALAFYLLRDDQRLSEWFQSVVGQGAAYAYATAVDRDLNTVYFGNILTAFVIAIVAAIVYNALAFIAPSGLGIPSPTLLGLLTGVGSLIPVIGMKLVYGPVAAYLGVNAAVTDPGLLWFPLVFALIAFVVIDTIPELLLRPYLSGRDLHVGMVMVAYILGPLLFGWYGLFLAPLLLVLVVQAGVLVLPELAGSKAVTVLRETGDEDLFETNMTPGAAPAPEATGTVDDQASDATNAKQNSDHQNTE
jgi:predicted PurR-regulated permease PerM